MAALGQAARLMAAAAWLMNLGFAGGVGPTVQPEPVQEPPQGGGAGWEEIEQFRRTANQSFIELAEAYFNQRNE